MTLTSATAVYVLLFLGLVALLYYLLGPYRST
jgi:hypothetical protein